MRSGEVVLRYLNAVIVEWVGVFEDVMATREVMPTGYSVLGG